MTLITIDNIEVTNTELEYVHFISNVYCRYYLIERHLAEYNALILYSNDRKIAESEVELIMKMGYIPESADLINWPSTPKSSSEKPAVFTINRVNRVMKLFNYGVSQYNANIIETNQ